MGKISGRKGGIMFRRKIRSREDIEFEWLEKARVQMLDSMMNCNTDIEFFKFRLKQEKNEDDFAVTEKVLKNSIKDKAKELEKVEHVYKDVDRKVREYK